MSFHIQDHFNSSNPQMQKLLESLPYIAATGVPILIQAESGTGKELLTNHLHAKGPRSTKPLIALNCAAIPDSLLESELFGHKKGSFTGAISDHKGVFEAADGGTLFLDEIGDMPLNLQGKLLRVLQNKVIRAVGSSQEKKVDFNLISATHRNLKQEIKMGHFREDLFYRLNVMPLSIPPLRQRREDIPHFIQLFLDSFKQKYGLTKIKGFSAEALENLIQRRWSGNVRQLENLVEQIVVIHRHKEMIELKDLPDDQDHNDEDLATIKKMAISNYSSLPTMSTLTDDYIHYVLNHVNAHQGEAARILGVSRRTIARKLNPKPRNH